MIEKTVMDASMKTVETAQQGIEQLAKKAWSIMDAAAEKQQASQFLSENGIKAIQGKG